MIAAALLAVLTSCTENDVIFDEPQVIESVENFDAETLRCIDSVYAFCLTFFDIPASLAQDAPTTEQMLDVIRYCDLQDKGGDIFCGWDEYDTIAPILWPNGYGQM